MPWGNFRDTVLLFLQLRYPSDGAFLPKFTFVRRPNIWEVNCKRIAFSDVALEISDHQSSGSGASGTSYGE